MNIVLSLARNALVVFAILMGTSNAARADAFFDGLDGNWQGSGFIKTDPKAPEESVRCRLNLGLSKLKDRLYVRGSCSIAGFMMPVNGSIVANGGRYSADLFRNLVKISTSDFSGRRRGSSLTLVYSGTDLTTKEAIRAAMSIRKRRGGFDISLSRTHSNSSRVFNIGTIKFSSR